MEIADYATPGRGCDVTEGDLHPLLYQEQGCRVCHGKGYWQEADGRHACECCGGSGRTLTDLGLAIWRLAERAALANRQSP
jgi:hypothetical protein